MAVIRDRDYDNVEEIVRQFRERAEKTTGEAWERVKAAIGYALYENDDTVDDVFRRAVHRMFEQKRKERTI